MSETRPADIVSPISDSALPNRVSAADASAVGPFLFGDALRSGVSRPLQMQSQAHRRLSRASGLSAALIDMPGLRGTVNIDHIKHGYYSINALNPGGIVPLGPEIEGLTAMTAVTGGEP